MPNRRMCVIGLVVCTMLLVMSGSTVLAQPVLQNPRSTISASSSPMRSVSSAGPLSNWFPISPVSNTAGHNHEWHPAVTYNSQYQEYLTVWEQADNIGGNYVYGQLVNRRGGLVLSRFLVPGFTGSNSVPDVAYNPARNEYLVVFVYSQAGFSGVYGQRLDANGSPVETPVTFASSATYTFAHPAVAFETATGQYLVTWQKHQGTAFSGIEARALSGDGTTFSTVITITDLLANVYPANPDVACTRTLEGCLVVWDRLYEAPPSDHEVHGARVHLAGGAHLEGPISQIFFSFGEEANPAVAAIARPTGIGQYFVVCSYGSSGAWSTVGKLLTDAGAFEPSGQIDLGSSNSVAPSVAGNESSQEYLVAWPTAAGTEMQALTVSTLGVLGALAQAQPSSSVPMYSAIASGPYGDFLVTYQDYYSGYPSDVFGWLWGTRVYLPLLKRN